MTGSKVTMYDLKIDGIVDLPTVGGGTVRALQFSMDKAVTPDFQLSVPGPAGKTLLIKSSALTVDGHVKFYATRFTGKILGIPLTLSPASPLPPDGIPLTMPLISFDDPEIQLAFVHSDTLTTPDLRNAFPS